MTVTLERSIQRYIGLAADDKPTDCDIGSSFLENDTGRIYRYDGREWRHYTPTEALEEGAADNTLLLQMLLVEFIELRKTVQLACNN